MREKRIYPRIYVKSAKIANLKLEMGGVEIANLKLEMGGVPLEKRYHK
jgi:hypothetical protein